MDFTNYWFPKKQVASGDPGDPIGQSLRFSGGCQLYKDSYPVPSVWTASFWMKQGFDSPNRGGYAFSWHFGSTSYVIMAVGVGNSASYTGSSSSGNCLLVCRNGLGTWTDVNTNLQVRDNSAWYHHTIVSDNGTLNWFINGNIVGTVTGVRTSGTSSNFTIGGQARSSGINAYFSEFYFIDGQALEPTTFARENDYGVWVPVRPGGLAFGSNGFHLDFSDPNDLGADRSGNDNHFTATGFETAPVGIWSNMFDLPDNFGGFRPGYPRQNMFDGDDSTWAQVATGATNNDELPWQPDNPIAYTQLEYFNRGASWTLTQEDGTVTTGGDPGGNSSWTVIDANPGTLQRLVFVNTTAGSAAVGGIRINGDTVLTDNTGEDYDLMLDSPTQNFATFNPVLGSGTVPLRNGNLSTNASSAWQSSGATFGLTSGQWVWEGVRTGSGGYFGIVSQTFNTNPTFIGTSGFPAYSVQLDMSTYVGKSVVYVNNTATPGSGHTATDYGTTSANTDSVVRVRLDVDNTQIAFDIDGVEGAWLDYSQWLGDYPIYPVASTYSGYDISVNYGQQPFVYTPPAGFSALQSQNVPEVTIRDGREHFQVLTNGSGVGRQYFQGEINITSPFVPDPTEERTWGTTQTEGTNYVGVVTLDAGEVYNPLTVWSTSGNSGLAIYVSEDGINWTDPGTTTHDHPVQTFNGPARYVRYSNGGGTWQADYFRGVGALNVLEQAQEVFPQGLWWIKDRENSNHHQLLDSVRGGNFVLQPDTTSSETSYVAPTGSSVAWCWKAGDSVVTDNTGTIESEVCVNHDAGFSIVQWVGTGGFGSIGHGLGKRPGMVITRTRQGDHWIVGVDGVTTLSNGGPPEAWVNNESFVGTNWENGLILNSENPATTYVASSGINKSGDTMMAYVWAPIEEFSAFGSYTGNSAADGPFIYTGFRPAFILIKSYTTADHWFIWDTTRDINNPARVVLSTNRDAAELAENQNSIDILSNGFKIRTVRNGINGSGRQFIWASFAENPFSHPTTAR